MEGWGGARGGEGNQNRARLERSYRFSPQDFWPILGLF